MIKKYRIAQVHVDSQALGSVGGSEAGPHVRCEGARAWGGPCLHRQLSSRVLRQMVSGAVPRERRVPFGPSPWTAALPEGEVRCSQGTLAGAHRAAVLLPRICAGKPCQAVSVRLTSGLSHLVSSPVSPCLSL